MYFNTNLKYIDRSISPVNHTILQLNHLHVLRLSHLRPWVLHKLLLLRLHHHLLLLLGECILLSWILDEVWVIWLLSCLYKLCWHLLSIRIVFSLWLWFERLNHALSQILCVTITSGTLGLLYWCNFFHGYALFCIYLRLLILLSDAFLKLLFLFDFFVFLFFELT